MTSLEMPVLFLNKNSSEISHNITSLAVMNSQIYTGSQSGEICIWKLEQEQYVPDMLMSTGSEFPCKALTCLSAPYPEFLSCNHLVVSLHGDNRVRSWDSEDGRCIAASRNELLPEVVLLEKIENVQMRAIALGARNKKIFLVDVWSMTVLYELLADDEIVSLFHLTAFGNHLAALSLQGQISFWGIPNLTGYLMESDHFLPEVSKPSLTLIMQSGEKPSILASTPDCSLLAISYKTLISFIHNTWYEQNSRKEAYIYLKKDISSIHFSDRYFYILTSKGKLLRYSISDILTDILPKLRWDRLSIKIQKESVNSTQKTFIIKRKPEILELDVFISKSLFNKDKLVVSDDNKLHYYDCNMLYSDGEYDGVKSHFLISNFDSEFCADFKVSKLLDMNESISTSLFVTTESSVFYLLGSSKGRIFVCPMSDACGVRVLSHHKDEVTCLYYTSDKIISCSADFVLCVWSLGEEDICMNTEVEAPVMVSRACRKRTHSRTLFEMGPISHKFHQEPLQVIHIYGSPGKLISKVDHIFEQQVAPENKRQLKNMILIQAEDGSLILVSLNINNIICKFQAVSSKILSSAIHIDHNYLCVLCEDNFIYIFNMSIQALERIIPSSNSELLFRKTFNEPYSPEIFSEALEYSVLNTNRGYLHLNRVINPFLLKDITIGGAEIPALYTNFSEIRKRIPAEKEVRMICEYLLYEMYSWSEILEFKDLFREDMFKLGKNSVRCCLGVFGVEDCISVLLPRNRRNWEISRCFYSMISVAFLSLADSLSLVDFKFGLKIPIILELMINPQLNRLGKYKFPDPVLFTHYCISTIPISLQALKYIFKSYTQKEKSRLLKTLISIYKPLEPLLISEIDSILTILIAYLGSDIGGINDTVCEKLIFCMEKMISTKKLGMTLAGCEMLSKGWDVWELEMSIEKSRTIMLDIIQLIAEGNSEYKSEYIKHLKNIANVDLERFLQFVSTDIMREDRAFLYAPGMLEVISSLIQSFPHRILFKLKQITDIIIHSLNPSYRKIRERCILPATGAIKELVTHLPMVCFTEKSQRLGIGTPEGEVLIYDLEHGSSICNLQAHNFGVSALEFSHFGDYFASYSIEEHLLTLWKEESNILFSLFKKGYKEFSSIKLHSVESSNPSFPDLLKTPNIAWSSNDLMVQLTREDGKKYIFQRND
jgi:hypothetical protein